MLIRALILNKTIIKALKMISIMGKKLKTYVEKYLLWKQVVSLNKYQQKSNFMNKNLMKMIKILWLMNINVEKE